MRENKAIEYGEVCQQMILKTLKSIVIL